MIEIVTLMLSLMVSPRVVQVDVGEVAAADSTSALVLAGDLERGEYDVGFRHQVLPLSDGEAAAKSTALSLSVWYPAVESPGAERLTLAEYYRSQEGGEPTDAQLHEWLREDMTSPPTLDAEMIDLALNAPTWAADSLPWAAGRHPLALWSYRDSVPTMQPVLNEYLASHGYVVAFAWPVDNPPPLPWEGDLTAADKAAAVSRQVDLMEAALRALSTRTEIDIERSAVLAWSYGGESATLFQQRHAEVKLVLGVDATIVSSWIFQGEEALAETEGAHLSAAYALLRNGRSRIGAEPSAEPPLLAEVAGGAWFIRFPRLSHGNFNFPGGMLPGVLGLEEVSSWAVGGADARRGYEAICRASLGMLDHVLRQAPLEPSWWVPGVGGDFVVVRPY